MAVKFVRILECDNCGEKEEIHRAGRIRTMALGWVLAGNRKFHYCSKKCYREATGRF